MGDAVSSPSSGQMYREEDCTPDDDWAAHDPNVCSACGGPIADGVRMVHEDGGHLCLPCARIVLPEQTKEAERMWRELNETNPKSSE